MLLYLLLAAVSDDGLGLDDGGFSGLCLGVFYRRHDRRGVGAVSDHLSVPPVRFVPMILIHNPYVRIVQMVKTIIWSVVLLIVKLKG